MLGAAATLLTALILTQTDYFTYSDCNPECIQAKKSCIITEINEDYFPCTCVTNKKCETLAGPNDVCLRPNKPPLGGENIWEDYKRHRWNPTTTTTEKPAPTPIKENCEIHLVAVIILVITTMIGGTTSIVQYLIHNRRSTHDRLIDNHGLYHDTTENLEDN
jgi:hypothetical protein